MKTFKIIIEVEITTEKEFEQIKKSLNRGIYRGLDTEHHYIASPKDVTINYIKETFFTTLYN